MRIPALALMGCAVMLASPAVAQSVAMPHVEAQAFGQCLTLRTTGADRLTVARWIGAAIASSPQLAGMVAVDPAGKEQADRAIAALFVRLFTVDCQEEARPLMKGNDALGIEAAFGVLGQVAMRELMGDRTAAQAMQSFTAYVPADAFNVFAEE